MCSAIAVSTGKQCRKHAMCGTTVCSIHNKTLIAKAKEVKKEEVKCLDCLDCFECFECPICCDKIKAVDLCTLPCHKTHVFHKSCIDLWVDESGGIEKATCPICRVNIYVHVKTIKELKNEIHDLIFYGMTSAFACSYAAEELVLHRKSYVTQDIRDRITLKSYDTKGIWVRPQADDKLYKVVDQFIKLRTEVAVAKGRKRN